MSEAFIRRLVQDIQQVDFREFWWNSQLLETCSKVDDSRVTQALLTRHHCLQNKQADSAHVIRNTIKEIEGPEFPTLWGLIDSESNTTRLIGTIDDPFSGTWAAAYVLGEIGGAPALSNTTTRLSPVHAPRHFLTAKLAYHLVVRYIQIQCEGEPTVTEFDTRTGQRIRVPARSRYPDVYERQMLRRQQANELFVAVQPRMLAYLKTHLSKMPDNFIPIPKQELFWYIERIPTSGSIGESHDHERSTHSMTTLDEHGMPAGRVTRLNDGRHLISAGSGADKTTLLMSLFMVFADEILPEQRLIFSRWANLPSQAWTSTHREYFALTMLHYFREVAERGGSLPPEVEAAARMLLGIPSLPPITKLITPDVKQIFESLFVR